MVGNLATLLPSFSGLFFRAQQPSKYIKLKKNKNKTNPEYTSYCVHLHLYSLRIHNLFYVSKLFGSYPYCIRSNRIGTRP